MTEVTNQATKTEEKPKKEIGMKAYGAIAFFVIAAFLAIVVVVTFHARYMGFHPDTIAENYVDSIVQKGDGYDAYKYTLMSKNAKFGDYVFDTYMSQYVNEKAKKSELTKNDDAQANIDYLTTMYPYYTSLIEKYGYDDIDAIFTDYFKKAVEVRKQIYGDDYITKDILFAVFEGNVATYGESLAGTPAIADPVNKDKNLVEAKPGLYDKLYGDNYIMVTTAKEVRELDKTEVDTYLKSMNADMLKEYNVSTDDITAVDECTVVTKLTDGTEIATQKVNVVKIGSGWYVDNTNIDTSALYKIAR